MMPGETHSKTAGIASEAAGCCQNCTSLQQSLNEYVAALIALKQKIIDSDQLLEDYQQKCDDLQYAERENETLRCELEQMLQKISPHEKQEEELELLKAELEEKTSSLKIYQQTEMEYCKVKEECEISDIIKKKLEAKLKKMEDAAQKHDKDYKQLKIEKKIMGKELKKIQKKMDDLYSEKSKKVTKKNAQTQVSREPVVKLDKQKIKNLLEQIWGCIESSTENDRRRGIKSKVSPKCRLSTSVSRPDTGETCSVLAELDTVQAPLNLIESNNSSISKLAMVGTHEVGGMKKAKSLDILACKEINNCCSVKSDSESDLEEMLEVQHWARPLPNLLSPIQCSPLTMANVFGELTDSSEAESINEIDESDCFSQLNTEMLPNESDENSSSTEKVEEKHEATDKFAVNTTVCSNDAPDLAKITNGCHLEHSTQKLPFQEEQMATDDLLYTEHKEIINPFTTSITFAKVSTTDVLKSPATTFPNSAFSDRLLDGPENVALPVVPGNGIQDAACDTEMVPLEKMDCSKLNTDDCHPVDLTVANGAVEKVQYNSLNCVSFGCFNANNSPYTEHPVDENSLITIKDMSISVNQFNTASLESDQKALLHVQTESSTEKENSSLLMDLHCKLNLTNEDCTLSNDVNICLINSVDVETISEIKAVEKNGQQSETLLQTSSLSERSNLSALSDTTCLIDCGTVKENPISDISGTTEKISKSPHKVVQGTTEKKKVMTISTNENHSTAMQLKTMVKKDLLEEHSPQKENLFKLEPDNKVNTMTSRSLFHNEDNLCKKSSPAETSDQSCATKDLNLSPAATEVLKPETEVQSSQVDTCNDEFAYSSKLVECNHHLCPPSTEHLNGECITCNDESSPIHSHAPFQSVVLSSPVHMVVDEEHKNGENGNKTQCQEVTPSIECNIDLDSSIPEETGIVVCINSKSNILVTDKISSKVLPIIPLDALQQLNTPSESNNSNKKFVKDTTSKCDESLDSSESEYDFPVRKVNITRFAFNNPVVRNESLKTSSDASMSNLDNALIEQLNSSTLAHNTSEIHVDTAFEPLDDSKVEKKNAVIVSTASKTDCSDSGLMNGAKSNVNVSESSSDINSKNINSFQKPDGQVSAQIHFSNDAKKNTDIGGQKILPGKNLIWNFSRPDDFVAPRVTQKQKSNICTDAESLVSRGSTGKLQECGNSVKLKCSKFQNVKKENPHVLPLGGTVSVNVQVGQTVLANADTSTSTGISPEALNKVRSEMGPPLPPLLGPLLSTPPRTVRALSPIMSSSSRSSLPSPLDELLSPLPGTPFPPLMSPLCDGRKRKSPVFNTPSPTEKANRRILSSPLQFCAATPKHAVPVPGRLPVSANGSSKCNVQENSVKILDTMYPELSARARTLNILKGNVQLNRGMSGDGQNATVSQITGFKSITSTSTVFMKTGSNSNTSNKEKTNPCETPLSSEDCTSVNKRTLDAFQMPKSAKRLRLDSEPTVTERIKDCLPTPIQNLDAQNVDQSCQNFSYCESLPDIVKDSTVDEDIISSALKKVEDLCFDLFPVIRSHVSVGAIPKVPVMRNEEKEVIYDFSTSRKGLADQFLLVLFEKIKSGKKSLDSAYLQALCRVYVGLCRQLGDIERARVLCYSILKEDFPDSDILLLFIISSWNDILSLHGVVSKAIQAVLKLLVKDEIGTCLNAYLNWEKSPPMNIGILLNSVLMAIQLYPDVKFHQSDKYGEDLTDNVWEYIFAVDLLCSHCKWMWTHENVISKELWPILDKWVKRKKGNLTIQFIPDVIVATVLRLIGHLCQMGLKEGFITAVKNIASVIISFINHASEEGVPWGIQLASVYMLCDTAPCDPPLIHQTLQAWKETSKNIVPPAVINCMQEIASLCVQDK
ncbi:little elongation complex subunit 1 isoform X2 [Engystomops pustulosus]|uniref:little elongation complex subunit 1 isoform X2 n=1 Tax=Engystomops pustulosus TaxID=76066 RepID=UPI003AFAFBFA